MALTGELCRSAAKRSGHDEGIGGRRRKARLKRDSSCETGKRDGAKITMNIGKKSHENQIAELELLQVVR